MDIIALLKIITETELSPMDDADMEGWDMTEGLVHEMGTHPETGALVLRDGNTMEVHTDDGKFWQLAMTDITDG
jgi:hypothetical protein